MAVLADTAECSGSCPNMGQPKSALVDAGTATRGSAPAGEGAATVEASRPTHDTNRVASISVNELDHRPVIRRLFIRSCPPLAAEILAR